MIVRLMGEGQFELDSKNMDEVNKIDNEIVNIVGKGDVETFKKQFKKLGDIVRKKGKPIASEIIKPSDVIVPPADLTFEEAKQIFKGEGLIPD